MNIISFNKILKFIENLKITKKDFCLIFDISYSEFMKIQAGSILGTKSLNKLEVFLNSKEAFIFQYEKNKNKINKKSQEKFDVLLKSI